MISAREGVFIGNFEMLLSYMPCNIGPTTFSDCLKGCCLICCKRRHSDTVISAPLVGYWLKILDTNWMRQMVGFQENNLYLTCVSETFLSVKWVHGKMFGWISM